VCGGGGGGGHKHVIHMAHSCMPMPRIVFPRPSLPSHVSLLLLNSSPSMCVVPFPVASRLTSMIENTLHRIWRGPLTVFSPDDTLQVMWEIFPRFSGFRQQVRWCMAHVRVDAAASHGCGAVVLRGRGLHHGMCSSSNQRHVLCLCPCRYCL
jgi:hypothetical protein